MRISKSWKLALTTATVVLVVFGLAPAEASSANISHSYTATANIPNGSLVSLNAGETNSIEPANTDNGNRLLGVAVNSQDSLLAVDASQSKVQVATSGNATALVSDLNGNINIGDQIAVSPFNGIGMKALPGSRIIGMAQSSFNSHSPGTIIERVKDKTGQVNSMRVGYVQVSIAIGNDVNGVALSSLQRLVQSITGHTVSTVRITISLIVLLVALVGLGSLIYASIYGGILAVGRNPLASQSIYRNLSSVLLMAVVTAAVASGAIYLLLR